MTQYCKTQSETTSAIINSQLVSYENLLIADMLSLTPGHTNNNGANSL